MKTAASKDGASESEDLPAVPGESQMESMQEKVKECNEMISRRKRELADAEQEQGDLLFLVLSQFVAILTEKGVVDGKIDESNHWVHAVLGQLTAFVRKYRLAVRVKFFECSILSKVPCRLFTPGKCSFIVQLLVTRERLEFELIGKHSLEAISRTVKLALE